MPEPIQDADGRLPLEITLEPGLLGRGKPLPCHRHHPHQAPPVVRQPLIIQFSQDLPETFIDQPDDMEAVQHNHGVWEPPPDQVAVCPVHVHADNPDPVPAPEGTEEPAEGACIPAESDVEDPAVPEVAEGRCETEFPGEPVLVNAEHPWTEGEHLAVFQAKDMVVETFHRGCADAVVPCDCRGSASPVAGCEYRAFQGFRGPAPEPDACNPGVEITPASKAQELVASHLQDGEPVVYPAVPDVTPERILGAEGCAGTAGTLPFAGP